MREYKLVVFVGAIAVVGFVACWHSPAVAQPPAGILYQAAPEPPPNPEQPPPAVQPAPVRPAVPEATAPSKPLEEITTQPGVSRTTAVKQDDEKINFSPPPMLVEPPKIELSKEELNTVKARIEYWKNIIVQSRSDNEVMKAKDRLIEDYLFFFSKHDESKANQSPDYQVAWARLAAAAFGPLFGDGLKKDDNLKRLKEINLSMVFLAASQIYPTPAEGKEYRGNIEIAPVVEKMVAHDNPAVRYFGWRAYKNLRIQLLAAFKGETAVARMRELISKGKDETSAPVLGSYFGMLDFPATDPLYGVKESVLTGYRKECYGIAKGIWGKWLPRVWQGDIDVAVAYGKGIECMKGLAPMALKETQGKKILLQNIMDLLYCSANSFDRQWNQVPVTTEAGQFASWFKYLKSEFESTRQVPKGVTASGVDNPVIQASIILTLECEKALNAILGLKEDEEPKQKAYIKDAWKSIDVIMVGPEGQPKKPVLNDRSEKLFDAVKKWADDLKDLGVEFPPKIAEPPALPQEDSPMPATQPAKAPTPAPPK